MALEKKKFSDVWIRSLKASNCRKEFFDTEQRGLGLRVTHKGSKIFFLMTRFPGSKHPTRRTLFEYSSFNPDFGLSAARALAATWKESARRGIDLREIQRAEDAAKQAEREDEERQRIANEISARHTYEFVVRKFWELGVRHMRESTIIRFRTTLDRRCMKKWKEKHISEILRTDVVGVLNELRIEGKIPQGFNTFAHLRAFFNWVESAEDEGFGLVKNPCRGIDAVKILGGEKSLREYDMPLDEIRAVWRATNKLSWPYNFYFQLLFLSMQRKSEVSDAAWAEFDTEQRIWTIPADRMKNGRSHVVPLPDVCWSLIKKLPRYSSVYLFSNKNEKRSTTAFQRAGRILAKEAMNELRDIYLERGLNPDEAKIGFRIHDLRRAGRSALSRLRVPGEIAELVISHTPPKLVRVYDKHDHLEEKRSALEAWANYLTELAESKPSNVVRLRA